jgi:hypothetical protein
VKFSKIQSQKRISVILILAVIVLVFLEFYGKIFERGLGNYLKWQNSERPQLGRVWDKDRESILAQTKIK